MRRPAVRVGIVGAGNIARSYGDVFERSTSATVVAVADPVPERAAALADRFGCPVFASHEAMLARAHLDAAVVCTPPAFHADVAVDLLEASVPVLCEKPLTTSTATARRMLDAAVGSPYGSDDVALRCVEAIEGWLSSGAARRTAY